MAFDKRAIAVFGIGLSLIFFEWYAYIFSDIYIRDMNKLIISIIATVIITAAIIAELKNENKTDSNRKDKR